MLDCLQRVLARDGGGEVAADGGGGGRLWDRPAAPDHPLLTQTQEEGGNLSVDNSLVGLAMRLSDSYSSTKPPPHIAHCIQ